MSTSTSTVSTLARELQWSRLAPGLTVGLIAGILEIILAISFAALIFSGPLSPFLPNGIGLALVGAVLSGATVALLSSAPGAVSGNQDVPSAIMAVAAAAIAVAIPAAAEYALYVTVVVMIGLTTAITGTFFYALARFRLGNLVRFLPYPVVGGFLAATGWLLLLGGISIMIDFSPTLDNASLLLQPAMLLRWMPGLLLAGAIVVVQISVKNNLVLPGIVFGSVALFYGVAALAGQAPEALLSGGWLLGPFPEGRLWQPLTLSDLALVDWAAIGRQIPNIATIVLMSTVALLLNSSGLELAMGRDLSPNRELRAAGIGNLLAGGVGGLIGFQQLSLSVMNHNTTGGSRLAGLFAAAICAFVLIAGASALSLFPKLVLGALVCFLGLTFLQDTVIASRLTLPRGDYAVMLLILVIAATIGFMEAVGVGLLAAVGLFVVNYSRTDVVRDELTGRTLHSRVTRSPEASRRLDELGVQLVIMRLQGFIFFGTADSLLGRIRERLDKAEDNVPSTLLLDFRHVTGVDSTAISSFARLIRMAQRKSLTLVLTAPSAALREQLADQIANREAIRIFDDIDLGLEWCEEQLLASKALADREQDGLQEALHRHLSGADIAQRVLSYFERLDVEAGRLLMRQGEPSQAFFLMESGQVSAYLEGEDGNRVRLQTMCDWNVLGEIGFFLDANRTATVVAEKPGVFYRASRQALAEMQEREPEVAAALQQMIIELLAERVTHLVTVVNALRR